MAHDEIPLQHLDPLLGRPVEPASSTAAFQVPRKPVASVAVEESKPKELETLTPPVARPEWKPQSLQTWYLTLLFMVDFIFLLLNLGYGVKALSSGDGFQKYELSERSSSSSQVSKSQRFCYFYLPVFLAFAFSQAFQCIDIDYKALYPLLLLARPQGATAREGLFTRYSLLNTHKCFSERRWTLLLEVVVTTIPSYVYPFLASTWVHRVTPDWDSVSGGDDKSGTVVLTTSQASVGMTAFFIIGHGIAMLFFMRHCRRMTTGLVASPHSISSVAHLARDDEFRAVWRRFPAYTSIDSMEAALGKCQVNLDFQSCHHAPKLLFDHRDTANVNQLLASVKRTSRRMGKKSAWRRYWWQDGKPMVLRTLSVLAIAALSIAWFWIVFKLQETLSLQARKVIALAIAMMMKSFYEAFDMECRFQEPFRLCRVVGARNVFSTIQAGEQRPTAKRAAYRMIFIDLISTPPFLAVWRFGRYWLMQMMAIAGFPWILEMWIVLVGMNEFGARPTPDEASDNNVEDEHNLTQFPGDVFMWVSVLYVVPMIYMIYFSAHSQIQFTLPRFPDVLAARISYLHSSQTLLNTAAEDHARRSSGRERRNSVGSEPKKFIVGWFHYTGDSRLQLRIDAEEECLRGYYSSERRALADTDFEPAEEAVQEPGM